MMTPEILRDIIISELKAYRTLADQQVFTFSDWPTNMASMPAILVYDIHDVKESMTRAQPNFTTTTVIKIDARAMTKKLTDAQKIIGTLRTQIEKAILTSQNLQQYLQQVAKVVTTKHITSEGEQHIARLDMDFYLEYFQAQEDYYAPANAANFSQINVNIDLINIYDAAHVYSNPPFPTVVTPAPRLSGPDGRNEGFLQIDVPTP